MTAPALEVMNGIDVLVIGDAMLDRYLLGSSERLCQEAPVPVVDVAHTERLPGGAANVARIPALLRALSSVGVIVVGLSSKESET